MNTDSFSFEEWRMAQIAAIAIQKIFPDYRIEVSPSMFFDLFFTKIGIGNSFGVEIKTYRFDSSKTWPIFKEKVREAFESGKVTVPLILVTVSNTMENLRWAPVIIHKDGGLKLIEDIVLRPLTKSDNDLMHEYFGE